MSNCHNTGVAVQSVERSSTAMVRSLVPHGHLPLVGVTVHLHLRQPTRNALERIWIF